MANDTIKSLSDVEFLKTLQNIKVTGESEIQEVTARLGAEFPAAGVYINVTSFKSLGAEIAKDTKKVAFGLKIHLEATATLIDENGIEAEEPTTLKWNRLLPFNEKAGKGTMTGYQYAYGAAVALLSRSTGKQQKKIDVALQFAGKPTAKNALVAISQGFDSVTGFTGALVVDYRANGNGFAEIGVCPGDQDPQEFAASFTPGLSADDAAAIRTANSVARAAGATGRAGGGKVAPSGVGIPDAVDESELPEGEVSGFGGTEDAEPEDTDFQFNLDLDASE